MGKASILLVLGFSLILGVVSPNLHRLANRSSENYLDYLKISQAHNLATSAANMAANQLFIDTSWKAGYSNIPFSGGTYSVAVKDTGVKMKRITAVGVYQSTAETVSVLLQPSSFAKFAYYSKIEGAIDWISKDTVWGPLHSQAKLNIPIPNSPVFYGKVTTRLGTNPTKTKAKFYGGYQKGVDLNLPADISGVVNAANAGGKVFATGDLWITFAGNNVSWKTSATGTVTTQTLSSFAPNGVVLTAKGNIHVQGTFQGRATLCATGSSGLAFGNIYIDDDIRYTTDPRTGPSTDMLGLVTENNVFVTDNTANRSDCRIDATLFCLKGGLTAENYNTRPLSGTLYLYGGVTQYQRGPVGTYSGSTLNHGFQKNYKYDDRLMVSYPPFFPMTGSFEIISWLE